MSDLLSNILSFSPQTAPRLVSDAEYDEQIRNHFAHLTQILPARFAGGYAEALDLLQLLDPSVHSLSYLLIFHYHILAFQKKTNQTVPEDVHPGKNLWSKAVLFLRVFDPIQVRYAGHEWRGVVELVAKAAEIVNKPMLALRPIRDAILRLDPSGASFTSNHVLFSRLCLRARAYLMALPVIDKDIFYFPSGTDRAHYRRHQPFLCAQHECSADFITHTSGFSTKLTYRDHLQYFVYSSMIFMGLKEWKKALHILSIVISLPSINVVSVIMVEAYKKWILLSLLETGRPLPLPNMTPPHMANLYRSLARPYEAIADIFKKGNADRLKAEVDVGRSIWQMDNNTGLVEQVLAACRQHSILKMGNTFAALTMTDLSHRTMLNDVNFKEDELLASSLIISRKLNATLLNRKDAFGSTMLRFSTSVPSTDLHKETSIQQPLLIERQRLMVLCANVNESDKRLQLTKEHINTLRKGLKRNDNGPRDGSTLSKGASPEFDFEEDMMADLQ